MLTRFPLFPARVPRPLPAGETHRAGLMGQRDPCGRGQVSASAGALPGRRIYSMGYDFDRVYDRRGSGSAKWDRFDPDVLPMPVADMDFPSPEPVRRALRERVEHGFYGYGLATEDFHRAFTARLERRYGPYDAMEARGHADRRRALNPPEPTGKQGSEREARAVAG